jgi:signal transduction histidine kinase
MKATFPPSDFISSISHELKTPLNAIIAFADLLKENLSLISKIEDKELDSNKQKMLVAEANDFVKEISLVAGDMNELIHDLLDVGSLASGNFSIDLSKEIDIADVIKRSVRINHDFAIRRGIQIKVEIGDDLGVAVIQNTERNLLNSESKKTHEMSRYARHDIVGCHPAFIAGSSKIHLDAKRMKQILINLISNAIKYSPEKTEIKISCKENQKFLEIIISDQGFGMSEEEIDKAFEKYQTIENPNRGKVDSFGLGLPITKKLVELQNGKIEVRSKVNEGTEVILKFPYLM